MTHSCGRLFRRSDRGNGLLILSALVISGLLTHSPLIASDNTQPQASVIAPDLLTQVDQLLATDANPAGTELTQGMGPLVIQAQTGDWPDRHIHAHASGETQLNVTAIPLPNAFGMASLLLGVLLLAYMIRRYRTTIA